MNIHDRLAAIRALVFDFDGVLTDNTVYVDQDGRESVRCHRGDGLAFDALRATNLHLFILSTETNPVVTARGQKIRIPVFQGSGNKLATLRLLADEHHLSLQNILYVGNDLNDYHVMQACGFRVCPADSHPRIRQLADVVLTTCGGHGIVRELTEDVLHLDLLHLLGGLAPLGEHDNNS